MSDLATEFSGRRGPLFWLAFRTSALTVLTLGIYRFWMKTRLRRYYWSAVRPGGHPLEYVGEPVEKLLGFLIAVVILAFYIGIVNLILMFFSFALLQGNVAGYVISFVGVVPLWFYALYRARRYVLARTRWRGIRFGLEPGAWGYALRAIGHWLLTILSLGLLWPRMTFGLEKYRTDRTIYGSERFRQGGRWQMLYPAFLPVLLCVVGAAAGGAVAAGGQPVALAGTAVFLLLLPLAAIHYRVRSYKHLTDTKSCGGVGLHLAPKSSRVMFIYVGGYGLIAVCLGLVSTGLVMVVGVAFGATLALGDWSSLPGGVLTLLGVALYFLLFILWGVLRHVFVTLPLCRHYAEALTLTDASALAHVTQTARDPFREAEGFAEALDLGAAI